jgi:hypothetical protein
MLQARLRHCLRSSTLLGIRRWQVSYVCVCVCVRACVCVRVCVCARKTAATLCWHKAVAVVVCAHLYYVVLYVCNTAGHNIYIYIYTYIQARVACLQTCAMCMPPRRSPRCRSSVYALYWYKCTNTDVVSAQLAHTDGALDALVGVLTRALQVRILLYISSARMLLYMCPRSAMYLSSYYYAIHVSCWMRSSVCSRALYSKL